MAWFGRGNGMAWNGRGMVWHVMVRECYRMTWHVSGIVWHGRGMVWHGRNMVWHGMMWVWYGRTELSQLGSRWFVFVHGVCPNSHSLSEGKISTRRATSKNKHWYHQMT